MSCAAIMTAAPIVWRARMIRMPCCPRPSMLIAWPGTW